jgi:hypothetical protein
MWSTPPSVLPLVEKGSCEYYEKPIIAMRASSMMPDTQVMCCMITSSHVVGTGRENLGDLIKGAPLALADVMAV